MTLSETANSLLVRYLTTVRYAPDMIRYTAQPGRER